MSAQGAGRGREVLDRARHLLSGGLWSLDLGGLSRGRARLLKLARLVAVSFEDLYAGQITLRATGLVYTTLLSIVPLLAVSFSILKAFGVHNRAEPLLQRLLAPLGPQADAVVRTIIGFVGNIEVGLLGTVGLAMLLYSAVSLVEKVEEAFNFIWHVHRSRSFLRRYADLLSVIIVGPVLLFSALGLTASVAGTAFVRRLLSVEGVGTMVAVGTKVVPLLFLAGSFAALYVFVPWTKVRWRSALLGGACAALFWEGVGVAFTSMIVASGRYSAVYSGFAALVLFLIWTYANWLILLVGARIAYYHQYPHFLLVRSRSFEGHRLREKLAFTVMSLVARSFAGGGPRWTLESLVHELELPVEPVEATLATLCRRGLLLETGGSPPAYVPARALPGIRLEEILDAVRGSGAEAEYVDERHLDDPGVDRVFREIDGALAGTLGSRTLADLVSPATPPEPPPAS